MIHPSTLRTCVLLAASACLARASASHLCGGEILYTLSPGGVCQLEVDLYAASTSNGSTIIIDPGDGSLVTLALTDIDTLPGFCCNYRLEYTGVHTYVANGIYTLQTELSNRSADLLNIPNPTNQSLCLSVVINVPDLNTSNTSVRFLAPQTETYYVGNTLVHAVNAFDADGDSLSFDLGVPTGANCSPMNPYFLPHEVGAGNDTSWIDTETGTFSFEDPWMLGAHVLLIRCSEWRNGTLMGQVQRDMKLCVNSLTDVPTMTNTTGPMLSATSVNGVFLIVSPAGSSASVDVCDAGGRSVCHYRSAPADEMLDLRSLKQGVYVVRFTDTSRATRSQRVLLTP
ncbi:MAG: hypothetical protein WAU70_08270 [Flavobacteriales bacterium]